MSFGCTHLFCQANVRKYEKYILSGTIVMIATFAVSQEHTKSEKSEKIKTDRAEAKAGELYGEFCGNAIVVDGLANNWNDGIMFDIESIESVFISGFSVKLTTSYSGPITIYRKSGTHVGSENTPAAWDSISTVMVTDAGAGGLTFVPIEVGALLGSGAIGAFYIRGVGTPIFYSNGTFVGTAIVANSEIIVKEGTGKNGVFGNSVVPRKFIGVVHYCIFSQVVCDTAETQFNDIVSNTGIFFAVTAGAQEITINQVYQDFSEPTGAQFDVRLYGRQGTHEGFEMSSVGWSLLSEENLVSPAGNSPEAISQGLNLIIPANSTYSFFIVTDGSIDVDYTSSTDTVGFPFYSDGNIIIRTGKGANDEFSGPLLNRKNFNGAFDYCTDDLGVEQNSVYYLTVWPNPAKEVLLVSSQSKAVERIRVLNVFGQEVLVNMNQNNGEFTLDVSSLVSGAYFIQASIDNQLVIQKFIKL